MRARVLGVLAAVPLTLAMAGPAHAVGVTLSPLTKTVAEPATGTTSVEFTATPTCGLLESTDTIYNVVLTNGTATGGVDFASSATPVSVTMSCTLGLPGANKTFGVTVNADATDENDETFTVALKNGANAPAQTATVTITDDAADGPPAAQVQDASLAEGSGGGNSVLNIPVKLAVASGKPIQIDYALAAGTATAGDDFEVKTGTVSFDPGSDTALIPVNVVKDNIDEVDETLTATITVHSGSPVVLGEKKTGTGTILNDDVPVITIGSSSTKEGNTGATVMHFPVTMSNASTRQITVHWATADITTASVAEANRAKAGQDYTAAAGNVTFAPGATTGNIDVNITPEFAAEQDELFAVALSDAQPVGAFDPKFSIGLGAILNDDGTPSGGGGAIGNGPGTGTGTGGTGNTSGDTTKPAATLSRFKFTKPKRVSITITCPANEKNCRGTLTLFSIVVKKAKVKALRKEITLGTKTFVVPGGKSAAYTLNLSAKNAKLVKQVKKMQTRAIAVVRDDAGNFATVSKKATLKG